MRRSTFLPRTRAAATPQRRLRTLHALALAGTILLSSTTLAVAPSAATGALPGPRSATVGGEVFLGGNFIELGISNAGDFGTTGTRPDGFLGTDARSNIGMSVDHDGFGVGNDLRVDYFLPGGPEERFVVGYDVGGTTDARSGFALGGLGLGTSGPSQLITTVTDRSVPASGVLRAEVESLWDGVMTVRQDIRFTTDDKFFRNAVTITNISGTAWDSARYMRSFNPDNSVDVGGAFETENVVTGTVADDGFAAVAARTVDDGNVLFDTYGPTPVVLYSNDPRAVASVFGFSNADPFVPNAYDSPRPKGDVILFDVAITLTCDSWPLSAGASRTFVYFTSLDERDFTDVLADIARAEEPSTPSASSGPSPLEQSVAVAVEQAAGLTGTAGLLIRGGAVVPLASTIAPSVGPRGGLVLEDEDGTLKVTITTAAGVSPSTSIVVPVDGEIVCEICMRLAAGSVIEGWVLSTPRLAGAVLVEDGEEGTCPLLRIPVGAPLDGAGAIEPGVHTLQLRMYTENGYEVLAVPITIGGPVPTSVPSGEGPGAPVSVLLVLAGLAGLAAVTAGRQLRTAGQAAGSV